MIPHHQNAVNMAKALLKTGKLTCDDLTDEESDQADDCALEVILREIINNQNAQIQGMRNILEGKVYPETNDCEVGMNSFVTDEHDHAEHDQDHAKTEVDSPPAAPKGAAPAPAPEDWGEAPSSRSLRQTTDNMHRFTLYFGGLVLVTGGYFPRELSSQYKQKHVCLISTSR